MYGQSSVRHPLRRALHTSPGLNRSNRPTHTRKFRHCLGHPSTFLMVIWPEARSAQNSIAAVSAEGSTVWVLIRRLNSSWSRSTALVVLADFHWLGGRRVKVNSLSPASSRLSAPARLFSRHL